MVSQSRLNRLCKRGRGRLAVAPLDDLDSDHETFATNVANKRILGLESAESVHQHVAGRFSTLHEPLLFQDIQNRVTGRQTNLVVGPKCRVVIAGLECSRHLSRGGEPSKW